MSISVLFPIAAAHQDCALIFAVAPTEVAARRIAETVVASGPPAVDPKWKLEVEQDPDRPGNWVAYQYMAPGPERGGGGLQMRIDACTGAVSDLYFQR